MQDTALSLNSNGAAGILNEETRRAEVLADLKAWEATGRIVTQNIRRLQQRLAELDAQARERERREWIA